MKRHIYEVNFVDMGKKIESFRVPQCRCGKLARRHYEVVDTYYDLNQCSVAYVVCEKCFEDFVVKD